MDSLSPLRRGDGSNLSKGDIDELKSIIKGTVVVKGLSEEEEYRAAIDRWAENSIKEAFIIVFVEDEEDISTTIKFVTKHDLDVAIAGGRHSYHGASSANGFVIDLRRMNNFTIDREAETITAQGGCKAEDIEGPLEQVGLSVVMGHVNDTGIGGLTLGGGSGWLTGQYGHIVDNLLAARVALADGRVVTASPTENSDLFWGIRGGGCNFGVCSEFTYQAHKQGAVLFGFLIFPPDKFHGSISLTNSIYTSICQSHGKFQAFFVLVVLPGTTIPSAMWVVFHDSPDESLGRSYLQPLYDLGPSMDTVKMANYASCNELHKQFHPPEGYRRVSISVAQLGVPIDLEVLKQACEEYGELMEKYGETIAPSQLIVELQSPYISKAPASTAMAYANRDVSVNLAITLKWNEAENDEKFRAETVNFIDKTRKLGNQNNEKVKNIQDKAEDKVTVYANYSGGRDKVQSVFGANLEKLRSLKRKFDPRGFWDKWYFIDPEGGDIK